MFEIFKSGDSSPKNDEVIELTNQFYTLIPHFVGRSREGLAKAVIASMQAFEEKQELLQLMRDMLRVTAEGNNIYWFPNLSPWIKLHLL